LDSKKEEERCRKKRGRLRNRLECILEFRKNEYKKWVKGMRKRILKLRKTLRKKYMNKIKNLKAKRKPVIPLLKNLTRYKDAKIFKDSVFEPGMVKGPVVVGEDPSLLSWQVVAILTRGPKLTIRRVLDREKFVIKMEKAFIKVRWELRDKEDWLEESKATKTARDKEIEEEGEIQEAKSRMVYDDDTQQVNFQNLRATDAKHNVRIVLPGPMSSNLEGELEMRRIQWGLSLMST
jgi:hypothetical protein